VGSYETRANMLFHRFDRNADGLLNKDELEAVFGGKAAVMLRKLVSDENDCVDMEKWMAFIQDVEDGRGPQALSAFLAFLEKTADDIDAQQLEVADLVLEEQIAEEEEALAEVGIFEEAPAGELGDDEASLWGESESGNTTAPPEIFIQVVRPDLFEMDPEYMSIFEAEQKSASLETPKRDFSKTAVYSVATEFDRSVNPRTRLDSGMTKDTYTVSWGAYIWELQEQNNIVLGDTIFHTAARFCNLKAIQACVAFEFELARRNRDEKNPFECIPDNHPDAEAARGIFPQDWRRRYDTLENNKKNYVQAAKVEKQRAKARAEAEAQAAEAARIAAEAKAREDAALALAEERRQEAIHQAEEELQARIEAQARRQAELERQQFEASLAARAQATAAASPRADSIEPSPVRRIEPRVPAVGSPAVGSPATPNTPGRSRRSTSTKPALPEAARGKQTLHAVRKSIYDDYARRR